MPLLLMEAKRCVLDIRPNAHLPRCRWARERYEKAQHSLVAALRRLGASTGEAVHGRGEVPPHLLCTRACMPCLKLWHASP